LKVSKYDVEWQFFRNSLKSKKESQKRILIKNFLKESSSLENKERLVNYIKGCFYDEPLLIFYINLIEKTQTKPPNPPKDFCDYSSSERIALYRDLFNRNKKWLTKGYYNKDLNLFIDKLSESLPLESRKTEELQALRLSSLNLKNTWKFIY
jgi:hypothetical protein